MCVSVTCGGDGDGLAAVARAADVHGSDVDDVVLPGLKLQQTLAGRDRHDAPAGDTNASLPSSQTEERQRSQVSSYLEICWFRSAVILLVYTIVL